MAGVKGRSGGPRENSGGYREGAGRPKSEPVLVDKEELKTADPRAFLEALMADGDVDVKIRADAAKVLLMAELRVTEAKGKKEQRQEAAEQVASRFAPSIPPKLMALAGRKTG